MTPTVEWKYRAPFIPRFVRNEWESVALLEDRINNARIPRFLDSPSAPLLYLTQVHASPPRQLGLPSVPPRRCLHSRHGHANYVRHSVREPSLIQEEFDPPGHLPHLRLVAFLHLPPTASFNMIVSAIMKTSSGCPTLATFLFLSPSL